MELFGNSATIADIHREVGHINDYLRRMESEISRNNGINHNNTETIASYFIQVASLQEKIQSLLDRLSDRELSNLTLCWIDGRYLPLSMWNASYLLVMNQIKNELHKF